MPRWGHPPVVAAGLSGAVADGERRASLALSEACCRPAHMGTDTAGTGLDYRSQSSTNSEDEFPAPVECINPDPTYLLLNRDTGEIRPRGCRRLVCAACAGVLAWRRSLAIAIALPDKAITLTLVAASDDPDPWQTARKRVNRHAEWMRRLGADPGERVFHVEPNPKGTGYHAHVWGRGPDIPFGVSDEAARRAGLGWVHVERLRSTVGASAYGLKGLSYGLKGTQGGSGSVDEYLRCNGSRLTHQSRGFFAGGVRGCERAALAQYRATAGESPWVLVRS